MIKYMAVAVAVAVSGGVAVPVAVPVAGLTKRFLNHIQKDFLINVWGYIGWRAKEEARSRTTTDEGQRTKDEEQRMKDKARSTIPLHINLLACV